MATKIGSIYVEVRADKTPFQKDMTAVRSSATKAGKDIGKALGDGITGSRAKRGISDINTGLMQLSNSAKTTDSQFKASAKAISDGLSDVSRQVGMTEKEFAGLNEKMLRNQAYKQAEGSLRNIARSAGLSAKETKNMARQMGYSAKEAEKMTAAIHRTQSQSDLLTNSMGKLYSVMGLVAGVAGLGYLTKQTLNATAEIQRNANMAGISTKAYQELAYAAKQHGITQEAITDGVKEMTLRFDEFVKTGAGPGKEAIETLGFRQKDLNKLLEDTPALLQEVIKRMEGMGQASKLRIADEIFGGQGGEQFTEIINAGADSLKTLTERAHELGLVMNKDLIEQSKEAKLQIETLTDVLGAQFATTIAELAPDISEVAENMTDWVIANKDFLTQDVPGHISSMASEISGFVNSKEFELITEYWELMAGAAIGFKIGSVGGLAAGGVGAILGAGAGGFYSAYKDLDALLERGEDLPPMLQSMKDEYVDLTAKIEKYQDTVREYGSDEQKAALQGWIEKQQELRLEMEEYISTQKESIGQSNAANDISNDTQKNNNDEGESVKNLSKAYDNLVKSRMPLLKQEVEEMERLKASFMEDYYEATLSSTKNEARKLEILKKQNEELVKIKQITQEQLDAWYDFEKDKIISKALTEEFEDIDKAAADAWKGVSGSAEKSASETDQVWDHALENIQDAMADWLYEWEISFDSIVDMAKRAAAQLAAVDLMQGLGFDVEGDGLFSESSDGLLGDIGNLSSVAGVLGKTGLISGAGLMATTIPGTSALAGGAGVANSITAGAASGGSAAMTGGISVGAAMPWVAGFVAAGLVLNEIFGGDRYHEADFYAAFGVGKDDPDYERRNRKAGAQQFFYGSFIDFDDRDSGIPETELETAFAKYFDNALSLIDESIGGGLQEILSADPYTTFQQGISDDIDHYFEEGGTGFEGLLSDTTDEFFKHYADALIDSVAGTETDLFDFNFLKGIQVEGENLGDTFIRFSEVLQSSPDSVKQITQMMEALGITAEQAFAGLETGNAIIAELTATVDILSDSAIISNLENIQQTWDDQIDVLAQLAYSTERLTALEQQRNEVLGANITGLSASSVEQGLLSGSSVNSIISQSINKTMAGQFAESLAQEYIVPLNQAVGEAYAESGGDIAAVTELLDSYDLSGLKSDWDEFLAELDNGISSLTREAELMVAEIVQGGLTASQMFEQWGIQNAEAAALMSEMTEGGVTTKELEKAVDAFSELGLEGDDLTTVIGYLTDAFVTASDELSNSLKGIDDAMSDIPSTENLNKTAEDSFKEAFNSFLDLPSLSTITDPGYEYTTNFDSDAYESAVYNAAQNIIDSMTLSDFSIPSNDAGEWWGSESGATYAAQQMYTKTGLPRTDEVVQGWADNITSGFYDTAADFSSDFLDAVLRDMSDYSSDALESMFDKIGAYDAVSEDDFTTKEKVENSGKEISSSQAEISAALDALEQFVGTTDYQGFFDTLATISSDVLYDIFGGSSEINELSSAYTDYLNSLESGSSGGSTSTGTNTDYDADQLASIIDQIQYDLDTINLSDFEKEIFDINKQVEDWNTDLVDLGYALSDAEELTGDWSDAQKKAMSDSLAQGWQDIIDENTLSDTELDAMSLEDWYNEQKAAAEALGLETDKLTDAYKAQKDAMEDSIMSPFDDFMETSGMSDIEKELYNINTTASEAKTSLEEMGRATEENIGIIDDWSNAQKDAMKESLSGDWQDIIDQSTMSDLELELSQLTTWYNEQKASAEALGLETEKLTEAYDAQKKAAYESAVEAARNDYIASLEKEQSILEDNLATAKDDYVAGLNREIESLSEAANEAENTANSFENLLGTLEDLKYSTVTDSLGSPDKRMGFVEAEIATAMARIQSGDPTEIEEGIKNIPELTSDFLELSKQTSGGFQEYQNDFAYVMKILNESEQIAGEQKSTAEKSLDELTSQTEELEKTLDEVNGVKEDLRSLEDLESAYNAAKTALDNSWYADEIERLTAINDSVLDLTDAQGFYFDALANSINGGFNTFLDEYHTATSAGSGGGGSYVPDITDGSTIPGDPENMLGGGSSSATSSYDDLVDSGFGTKPPSGMSTETWAAQILYKSATGGVATSSYNAASELLGGSGQLGTELGWSGDTEELRDKYGFASGGTVTGPESGYSLPTTFHGTEHITPDSQMTDVKKELSAIKGVLNIMLNVSGDQNKNSQKTYRILDRVTQGGNELRTKDIA